MGIIIGTPQPPTIQIGTQTWTQQNLNVTTYRNGDVIPQVTDPTQWTNLTTGAWCWYNNNSANGDIYGKLYNWYAVNDERGLAPAGYHIPTDTELTTLVNFLGGSSVAGGAMREAGTSHWQSPNTGATNSSGFTALPAGTRLSNAEFLYLNTASWLWSSYQVNASTARSYLLETNTTTATLTVVTKKNGQSVRLVKN
jgi:uncharacterized protein (TIGR02145 family)